MICIRNPQLVLPLLVLGVLPVIYGEPLVMLYIQTIGDSNRVAVVYSMEECAGEMVMLECGGSPQVKCPLQYNLICLPLHLMNLPVITP